MGFVKNEGKFLIESGLLFEINRLVLHKFGYSLIIDTDPDDRRKIIIRGLLETDDGDGWQFDEEAFEEGKKKYQAFLDMIGNRKLEVRKSKLGYIIQELGDSDEIANNE